MAKIHLLIVLDPAKEGDAMTALCGETIPNGRAVPLTEFEQAVPRSTVSFCKKCFGRRYFYAICDGQTVHDEFPTE